MACIFPIFPPLCVSLCIPLPPLEYLIGERRGYDLPHTQPNTPRIFQTPLPVYHYSSEFVIEKFRRGGGGFWTENQIWGWWWWKGCKWCQSFCISLPLLILQPCQHFLHMTPCSCLTCGISDGRKVFIYGCDCVIPHIEGKISMQQ